MTAPNSGQPVRRGELGVVEEFTTHGYERLAKIFEDFQDPSQEWRRLFSELLGTFLLVLVAAGGGMMGQAFPNTISRTAAVVAPALMVLGVILFMGKVSGAHLNPAVSHRVLAARRLPLAAGARATSLAQLAGACLAAWFLQSHRPRLGVVRLQLPRAGFHRFDAFVMEAVLTFGLVSVILGTASGAQNLGVIGALGVGGYIALAGLWGSPISGASMNPARTFGPDLSAPNFGTYWVYVAGPHPRRRHRRRCRLRAPRQGRWPVGLSGRPGRPVHRGRAARPGLTGLTDLTKPRARPCRPRPDQARPNPRAPPALARPDQGSPSG